MRKRSTPLLVAIVSLATLLTAGSVAASDPLQHGLDDGHLLGEGEYGKIQLVGQVEVTETEGLVADVAAYGDYAYLANWGEPDCAGPERGGVNSPDAGAWVIDISDPANPVEVNFIPMPQDTRPGEGMQVAPIETKWFSGEILVMNAEACGKNYKGGFMLYDVSNPLKVRKLSEGFGERTRSDTHQTHSAFIWQPHGSTSAYLVLQDEEDEADLDIFDITNPRRPRQIAELNLNDFNVDQPALGLTDSSLHDMTVKCMTTGFYAGKCIMIASYWDGGYVLLDVTDPANPVFLYDTDFAAIDPELFEQTGIELTPEGNAHQAEFTADNRFFIGTDEDFSPYRADQLVIITADGPVEYPSEIVPGGAAPAILPDLTLNGPVVYGGYGCPDSEPIPSPEDIPGYLEMLEEGEEMILVLQRGPSGDPTAPEAACFPGDKAHEAFLAGWDAVLFVNRHGFTNDPFCGSGAFVDEIVAVCTTHEGFHALFPDDPNLATYPDGPAIGTIGGEISVGSLFDGWGYVHLFDAATGAELDTFAIDEAMDPAYAFGFGDLTVHEVATDPSDPSLMYLSYYSGGLIALQIQCSNPADNSTCELVEVGGYLDEAGNNFWGVEVILNPDDDPNVQGDEVLILASDRDYGLFIFQDP